MRSPRGEEAEASSDETGSGSEGGVGVSSHPPSTAGSSSSPAARGGRGARRRTTRGDVDARTEETNAVRADAARRASGRDDRRATARGRGRASATRARHVAGDGGTARDALARRGDRMTKDNIAWRYVRPTDFLSASKGLSGGG